MRIALLSEKYTPDFGGLAISAERLARLLFSAGHEVRVFAPTSSLPPSETRTLPSGGVSVTRFGARKRVDDTLVDWFELLAEEHRRDPFNVLHAYFLPQAGFVAAYAGKYLNAPSVVAIRGNDIERAAFDPAKFSHVLYALQTANVITANARELVNKAWAFFDREIILVPNGTDARCFKPMEKNEALAEMLFKNKDGVQRLPTLADPKSGDFGVCRLERNSVIGFAGELREKKGIRTLLSAYTQVNKKRPVTLLVVGEVRAGEDKQAFDEFQLSNPDARVVVTGPVPHNDMPAYYALMDVFVHPSLRDGMPNALLEAMACGKAVIATPVGGMLDALEDGVDGLTVPVNDAGMLAEKILELLDDPEKRVRLGQKARDTILERFTPEKELEANSNIYQRLGR